MTRGRGAALIGGVSLLERATAYTLGSLQLVTPGAMPRPTPCRGWNLWALLMHMNDSLMALHEAAAIGLVDLNRSDDAPGDRADDPVATLRERACRLLGAWTNSVGCDTGTCHGAALDTVSIAGNPLPPGVVTGTGAIELAVHGWDVARACLRDRPIPDELAEQMLELCPLIVTDADRPARFAAPVDMPAAAGPGDQLLAFLGRQPR